jgi:fatty-acyl-CoA synthase
MTVPGAADAKFAREAWIRALQRTAAIETDLNLTLPVLIGRQAQGNGAAPALLSNEGSLNLRADCRRAATNTHAGACRRACAPGTWRHCSCSNSAEYVAVWLGLTRIGVTVALLNTHLAADALLHSIRIVAPRLVLVGCELAARLDGRAQRASGPNWAPGCVAATAYDFAALEPVLGRLSGEELPAAEYAAPTLDGTALYIYTSGTTGCRRRRVSPTTGLMRWSQWFAGLMDTQPQDRMYNCLPLYHSVGGIVAVGALLVTGGAVVIRARFSASDFWRDVRDERCTLFQYIGELCRYLVNAPRQPLESEHSLRLACGNGLRPEVWESFKSRFRIPRILEYYASTEGNFSLYNCEGQPGAIGRIPSFLAHRLPVALLRFDVEGGEPTRNAGGFCENCAVDEVGEAVGLIPHDENARAGRFEGYADPEASQRKVLRNVFKSGDAWYRTGDLMRRDAAGFYYFVDRIGETYRWKGENVSTAEVLGALTAAPHVRDGVVYGVTVPDTDGRAGMAALVVGGEFDLTVFRAEVAARLPSYARPVFLRLLPGARDDRHVQAAQTGTAARGL